MLKVRVGSVNAVLPPGKDVTEPIPAVLMDPYPAQGSVVRFAPLSDEDIAVTCPATPLQPLLLAMSAQ